MREFVQQYVAAAAATTRLRIADRMRRLLTALGSPQEPFRSIHVVGTNGKSSTVRMTAAMLERHGLRTGAFLSPHLVSFRERIRIGDEDLAAGGLRARRSRASRARPRRSTGRSSDGDRVTQFEALTAAAYAEFARRGVERRGRRGGPRRALGRDERHRRRGRRC